MIRLTKDSELHLEVGEIVRITFTDGEIQEGPVLRREVKEWQRVWYSVPTVVRTHHVQHPGGTSAAVEDYVLRGLVKVELLALECPTCGHKGQK